MEKPIRIQRKRTQGYDMQADSRSRNGLSCIYVGRPGPWGNPFSHTQRFYGVENSLALYSSAVRGIWNPVIVDGHVEPSIPYGSHHDWLKRLGQHPLERIIELRGYNLACWCFVGSPCHADILLGIANA